MGKGRSTVDGLLTCRSVRFADAILLKENGHVSSGSGCIHVDCDAEDDRQDGGGGGDGQGIHFDIHFDRYSRIWIFLRGVAAPEQW